MMDRDEHNGRYILVGRAPVPEPDLLRWAAWFSDPANRRVLQTYVGPFRVSTVFIGLDYAFLPGQPPQLFETMTFLYHDGRYTLRCATWSEAEQQHWGAVAWARDLWKHPFLVLGWVKDAIALWFRWRGLPWRRSQ